MRPELAKRNWNRVLWPDETGIELFGNRHSRWVWLKNKNADSKNSLYVSMVEGEVLWCCGAVCPWKGPGNPELHEIPGHFTSESGCSCQEIKTGLPLDLPAGQRSRTFVQINTKMVNWTQSQASAMTTSAPWPKPVAWAEEESEKTKDSGWSGEMEEWAQIPFSIFYNLIRCYRRRLCAVLLAKGDCTKY